MSAILGIPVHLMFGHVAASLAHCSNDIQAEFFNVFAKELASYCGTNYNTEIQCLSIQDKMTIAAKEIVRTIAYDKTHP